MRVTMELDKLPDPFTLTITPPPPPMYRHPIPEPQQFNTLHEFEKNDSVEAMREMIFRMAALQPVQGDLEYTKPPKRRNVKISKDPQSVAARHRRERISERIRILQRLVPGGTKMDTASILEEAVRYMKYLKKQVESLELAAAGGHGMVATIKREVNVRIHHQYESSW